MDFIAAIAYGCTKAALKAWAEEGPALVTATVDAFRRAMTRTLKDTPPPPADIAAGVEGEIADATK